MATTSALDAAKNNATVEFASAIVAFSDRANGFLSRPFFPDGIDGTQNGPFSKPINVWSPFNNI